MNYPAAIAANLDQRPRCADDAWISRHAFVNGNVEIGARSSVWPFVSMRGDIAPIRVGANSNIQDGTVVHVATTQPTVIGDWTTIGHKAIIHACEIGDEVLVGMGAIILDGVKIGDRCIIGANATVTGNTIIPPGSLVLGSPAKVKRELTDEERNSLKRWAEHYVILSREYRKRGIE